MVWPPPAQKCMNQNQSVVIQPAKNINGVVRLPGDKSISHRYVMLAALAEGTSVLKNFSTSADCASTLGCVRALGTSVAIKDNNTVEISGCGRELKKPEVALDCGNSGSTMRMLAGILAGQGFVSELVGDESLSRRPMARIMDPLQQMGARIEAQSSRAPLCVHGAGRALKGIEYRMPVASAQVKSSILFAGLLAQGETVVEEPVRTRDHGELALRAFGAEIGGANNRARIRGGQQLHAIHAEIPGDISSATFFLCAAAIFPESSLVMEDVLLNPRRAAVLDVLTQMGARVRVVEISERLGELVGTVKIEGGSLSGARIAGALSAALIDELPALAAIAPFTRDGVEIRDAAELRVKESDRIATVAANLRAMGATVEEHTDGMQIPGGQRLHGAAVDSHGDHRIAMAFTVAALRASGETQVQGADAVRISYPDFFNVLKSLVAS